MPSKYGNTSFYNSARWRSVSAAYMASQNYLCEICGRPAKICHHKIWLNNFNVKNPEIALDWSNLQAVCIECHNAIHSGDHARVSFDPEGNVESVKDTAGINQMMHDRDQIDDVLARARSLSVVSCGDALGDGCSCGGATTSQRPPARRGEG